MLTPGATIRLLLCIVATLFLLLVFREGRFSAIPGVSRYTSPLGSGHTTSHPLKVSILETKGCHDEVSASFFEGFGQMEECKVDAFLGARRFGIESIYDQLPGSNRRSLHNKTEFIPEFYQSSKPDVVLFITSEYSIVDKKVSPTLTWLFENTNCILLAVVHHPDEWKTEAHLKAAKPWIESRRIGFITLSNHVSKYMVSTVINTWDRRVNINTLPRVSTFPAVFTIPSLVSGEAGTSPDSKVRFAMQGDLIVNRLPNRDYEGTFQRFAKLVSGKGGGKPIELRVLGNGGIPKVPAEAKDSIQFDVALPYLQFYQTLQSATALLPAFSDASYYHSKASSTVAASFVAGAPLIAGDELLAAYTFVSREDVYYREAHEDEIDVIARVALIPERERVEKSQRLRLKNKQMSKNIANSLRSLINELILV